MVKGPESDETESSTVCTDPLPHLMAGRQVGWIFKYGEAVAIERHESESSISEDAS
jgi:hypothetical protein